MPSALNSSYITVMLANEVEGSAMRETEDR